MLADLLVEASIIIFWLLNAVKLVLVLRMQCPNRFNNATSKNSHERILEQRSINCVELWSNMASFREPHQAKCARSSLQLLCVQNMHNLHLFLVNTRFISFQVIFPHSFTRFDFDRRRCTVTKWRKGCWGADGASRGPFSFVRFLWLCFFE